MAKILARVLTAFTDGDLALSANNLISAESNIVKALEKSGHVDSDKAAVSYCQSEGAKPIDVIGKGQAAIQALADQAAAEKAAAEKVAADKAAESK